MFDLFYKIDCRWMVMLKNRNWKKKTLEAKGILIGVAPPTTLEINLDQLGESKSLGTKALRPCLCDSVSTWTESTRSSQRLTKRSTLRNNLLTLGESEGWEYPTSWLRYQERSRRATSLALYCELSGKWVGLYCCCFLHWPTPPLPR